MFKKNQYCQNISFLIDSLYFEYWHFTCDQGWEGYFKPYSDTANNYLL